MALFQSSVLKKYLKKIVTNQEVKEAYQKYTAYFHNPAIQENIRNSKEEQYQEGFLRELFVKIFGYIINPNPDYNLTTELKNVKNAKKADGAILKEGKPIAIIELKGTNTTDLNKVENQAFGYKNNHIGVHYVITSNFEKLRFYIDNAIDFEEFSLFNLSIEDFSLLWLLLAKDNLLKDLAKQVKLESVTEEEQITKKLYKDYSTFRKELFNSIAALNTDYDKLLLFKKTQKLLDRFLFIFFAEDRLLLPPNSTHEILKQWKELKENYDEYFPLYARFKKYFGYLDTGHKGKKHDIFAYNGGLFAPDEILDNIKIDDDLLYKHTKKLSDYDFESDIDVNILGHIFENSLNELEEMAAELENETIDKSKTKRKKDGVFYTPKYITKYIVDNTVGKLCEAKKLELKLIEEEYTNDKRKTKKKKKELLDKLDTYQEWLLNLTICDPACGSGAFLNQALDFLIKEHGYIDELKAKLLGASLILSDIENSILERNLYGVDINEESVEIAKLSLWLRTARPGRKLTSLNNNIKCGNSLIDDEVAGDKAFNWQKEFPNIFKNGGFDIVVGNPPYVRAELLSDYKDYLEGHYDVYNPASDLFAYFYELGSKIVTKNGLMGYISNTFDKTKAGHVLRDYLKENTTFINYIDFTEVQIFEGATTYPIILTLTPVKIEGNNFEYIKIPKSSQSIVIDIDFHVHTEVDQNSLNSSTWSFMPINKVKLFRKLQILPSLRDTFGKCYYGVKTALNEAFIVKKEWEVSKHIKYIYEGKEIKKWNTPKPTQKLILYPSKSTNLAYEGELTEEALLEKLSNDYPKIFEHLKPYEAKAKKRYDKGEFWWELRNCAYYDLFDKPKIIFPNLQNSNKFCLDSLGVYVNAPAVFLSSANKTLLCILNSKIVWEFLLSICVVRSGGYIEVKPQYFEQIPIPTFKNEDLFEKLADQIIDFTSQLQRKTKSLLNYISKQYPIDKFSRKLQSWYQLDFKDFLKELKKVIKKAGGEKLSKKDEIEWMELFEEYKEEATALQSKIQQTDKEIDKLVYELYGLTDEEIQIIEDSVKDK